MKLVRAIVVASLATNAILGVLVLRRPVTRPQTPATPPAEKAPVAARAEIFALQTALISGDAAALAAAGCPPEAIRALLSGRAFDRFQEAAQRARLPVGARPYWQNPAADPEFARQRQRVQNRAWRDYNDALRAIYSEGLFALLGESDTRFAFLSPDKRERLRRIEEDYRELEEDMDISSHHGIELSADRERRALLSREKERDLAAVLTPEEREQLERRTSQSANAVRSRFGDVLGSEQEFLKLYALQKAFDDRYSTPEFFASLQVAPELQRTRFDAERKLNEDFHAVLSAEQIAAVRRANDQDRIAASAVVRRLNLPEPVVDSVLATRDSYAAQSLQINGNTALTSRERHTQVQALVAKAEAELRTTLGTDGAQAYLQRSPWIRMLREGTAFSTDPKDAPTPSNALNEAVFRAAPPQTAAGHKTRPSGG